MNTSRERSCQGKARHRQRRHARVALAKSIEQTGDMTLVFYPCQHCNGFHIGHPPRAEQKRIATDRLIKLIEKVVPPAFPQPNRRQL